MGVREMKKPTPYVPKTLVEAWVKAHMAAQVRKELRNQIIDLVVNHGHLPPLDGPFTFEMTTYQRKAIDWKQAFISFLKLAYPRKWFRVIRDIEAKADTTPCLRLDPKSNEAYWEECNKKPPHLTVDDEEDVA